MENIREKTGPNIQIQKKFNMCLHFFVSFVLGRVFLLDTISPFAMAYLCSYVCSKKKNTAVMTFTVAFSVLGIITTVHRETFLKYLLSYVLFGLIYISVSTITSRQKKTTLYAVCAISNFLSGTIYYARIDGFFYNIIMVLAESLLCFALPFVTKSCADVICKNKSINEIKSEDIAGIFILCIILSAGFCDIYIGNICIAKVIGALFIMIFAFAGGCFTATTCGVGIGIVYSLYAFEFNETAGIFGFCGFCTGILSKAKRPGIILGFMLSSALLGAYFGGWSDSIFSQFETVISICIFCLVPYSFLMEAKNIFNICMYKNSGYLTRKNNINAKMKRLSKSYETLANLSARAENSCLQNPADISFVYEKAADKVCKTCGLKFVCWDKEAFDTRDALNKMSAVLNEKSYITVEDVPEIFKKKCIRHINFVNELNRMYCKYKIENRWQSKIDQSRKLISMQFNCMSDLLRDMSENTDDTYENDRTSENKIYYMLEQSSIHCIDVTVSQNENCDTVITIRARQRKTPEPLILSVAESVCTKVMGQNMSVSRHSCVKGKYTIRLTQDIVYDVFCSCKSVPKSGEKECGDSVSCGRISEGKYAVILSDGMGSGNNAAMLSKTTIQLMEQFLNAGFDKTSSINMIGSAIMLNSNESFTTMDAVIIDMYTAKIEFIKAGANTTYIKSNNCIRKIISDTLPIGILNDTEADTISYNAKDGDLIVLISDGISDSKNRSLETYLLNMHEDDPKIISELLIDEAMKNKDHDDDMTVAVIKILKR